MCAGKQGQLVIFTIVFTKQAAKDAEKLKELGLDSKAKDLMEVLRNNPFQTPPTYEKLVGNLEGAYSRRINIHNRLVYEAMKKEKIVKIIRMWTHYQ